MIYPFDQCEDYMKKYGIPIFLESICTINENVTLTNDGYEGIDAFSMVKNNTNFNLLGGLAINSATRTPIGIVSWGIAPIGSKRVSMYSNLCSLREYVASIIKEP